MLSTITEEEAASSFSNSAKALPSQQYYRVAVDATSDPGEELEMVSLESINSEDKENDTLAEQAQLNVTAVLVMALDSCG